MNSDSGAARPQQAGVPAARGAEDVVQQTTQVITPRDRVRWGPIWAGLLSALSLYLLGNILLIALGAVAVSAGGTGDAQEVGIGTSIVSIILGLLCFFFGGWVAAKTAAVRGTGNGVFNGFLVWALGTVLSLALAAFGLGQLVGLAGNLAGDLGRLISAGGAANLNPDVPNNVNVNRQAIAENIENSAFATFGVLGLPALAAVIGGALGARKDRDVEEF